MRRTRNGGVRTSNEARWKMGSLTGIWLVCALMVSALLILPSSASLIESSSFRRNTFGNTRELLDVQETTAKDGRSFLQYQTRRNWAGQDVSPEFCSYDEAEDKCQWSDYAQSLSLLATPPAVIGMFFLIFYIVLFLCRCCCVSARKCMLPWTGSSIEPWILRVALLIIAILIGSMAIMAHVGNAWAHEGINNLSDDSKSFASTVLRLATRAANLLVRIDPSQQNNADTAKLSAADVDDSIHSFIDILKKTETARFAIFLVTFIAIFGIGIGALTSICCFRRATFCGKYLCALIMLVPIFVVMAFCIVFGAATSDVCTVYDDSAVNPSNSIFNKILGSVWGSDCTAFEDLITPLYQEYNNTLNTLCVNYQDACNNAPQVSNCQPCGYNSNIELLKQTNLEETFRCGDPTYCLDTSICSEPGSDSNTICYQQNQTFAECVTQCMSPDNRQLANQTVYYVDLGVEVNDTLTEVMPYAGCGIITQLVSATNESLCVEFISGVFLIVVATIVLGALWIFHQLTAIIAFERAGLRKKF